MFEKGRGTRRPGLDFLANHLFSARLLACPGDGFFFDRTRNNQNAIHIAKNQITRF